MLLGQPAKTKMDRARHWIIRLGFGRTQEHELKLPTVPPIWDGKLPAPDLAKITLRISSLTEQCRLVGQLVGGWSKQPSKESSYAR
jgi:hypothetical protein